MNALRNRPLLIVIAWLCGLAAVASDPTSNTDTMGHDGAIVLHAGGAVRLEIPGTWSVNEEPVGRRIRLMLTPSAATSNKTSGIDGIWLMLNYVRDGQPVISDEALIREATDRLAKLTRGEANVRSATMVTNGNHRWALTDFTFAPVQTNQVTKANELRGGIYLLQHVDWASLEVFVGWSVNNQRALADVYANELVSQILHSIQLVRPTTPMGEIDASVAAAKPIIGTWKASRSRMQLARDGMITIVTDRPFEVEEPLDHDQATEDERRSSDAVANHDGDGSKEKSDIRVRLADTIKGRYRAEGDLLYTVWNDGSKLNYRWRRDRGALLLTDSEGRTSKLLPVLD